MSSDTNSWRALSTPTTRQRSRPRGDARRNEVDALASDSPRAGKEDVVRDPQTPRAIAGATTKRAAHGRHRSRIPALDRATQRQDVASSGDLRGGLRDVNGHRR